jgi:hypothetical protein
MSAGRVDACLALWRLVASVRQQRSIPAAIKLAVRDWALQATAALEGRPVSAGRLDQETAKVIVWSLLDALDGAGIAHRDIAAWFNTHARRSVRPNAVGDVLAASVPEGFLLISEQRLKHLSDGLEK